MANAITCMISFHTESTVITWSMDLYYPKVPQRTPGRLMRLPIGGEDNNDAVINKVPCVVIRVHPPSAFACALVGSGSVAGPFQCSRSLMSETQCGAP